MRGEIKSNKPTVMSFFCGAGGMDLGFIQAGFEVVKAVDWDSNAIKSYVENIGDHADVMDIKEMTYDDIPASDVWIFGFPCQDLSVAGKQKGLHEGERSSMFFHVMRLLQEVREIEPENLPKVIMAENVKGLKPYLGVLEEEYAKQGYKMQFQIFNSKYWGVPQNRERYFVVGIRDDLPQSFEFPEEQKEFVPKLSSVLETEVDEKYYISEERAGRVIEQALQRLESLGKVHPCITPDRVDKRQNGRRAKEEEAEMFTLTAQDLHGVIVDCKNSFGNPKVFSDDLHPTILATHYKEPTITIVGNTNPREGMSGRVIDQEGLCPTLTASDYKDAMKILEPKINVIGRLDMKGMDVIKRVYDPEGLAPTLTTSEGGHRQPKILEGYRVRKLTPREYMRLQGFPEDYQIVVSNTQMYKQMGNAVTVPKAKGTAAKIKEYLESL